MISDLMSKMISLDKKFHKEVENVDALHPNTPCDLEFLQKYIKVYINWVNYMGLPESHIYKEHYLRRLLDALIEIKEVM